MAKMLGTGRRAALEALAWALHASGVMQPAANTLSHRGLSCTRDTVKKE